MKIIPFIPSMFTSNVCWDAKSTDIVDIVLFYTFLLKLKLQEFSH